MPKREPSKCREWERERRERLKTCFNALARLLPNHDPSVTPSKLEILQRAATHITDLQQKNKELSLGDQQTAAIAQRDEIRRLRDRVRKLNCRIEQLVGLLRSADLKIPKECLAIANSNQGQIFKGPSRLWSGRISREKAEELRKQHESKQTSTKSSGNSDNKQTKTRKRKLVSTNKKSNGESPEVLGTAAKKQNTNNNKKVLRKSSENASTIAAKVAAVLGPGTLILANGNVVPVPAPTAPPSVQPRVQVMPNVTQNSSRQIIIMKTNTTNINNVRLPTIRPKTSLSLNRTVLPSKIAIPALPKRRQNNRRQKKLNTANNTVKITDNQHTSKDSDKNKKTNKETTEDQPTVVEASNKENLEKKIPAEVQKDQQIEVHLEQNKDKKEKVLEPEFAQKPVEPNKKQPEEPQISDNIQLPEVPTVQEQPNDPEQHSELSNDIFATLGGGGGDVDATGGQHAESMSPTAAFLLAFPLVSTLTGSRISESQSGCSVNGNGHNSTAHRNDSNNNAEEDRQSTPTTILQIGGTMNLNTEKSSSRTVIQFENPMDQSKNAMDSSRLSEINQIPKDNFGFFTENCLNPQSNRVNSQMTSSNACLYEQRSHQTNFTLDNYSQFQNNLNKSSTETDSSNKNRLKQQQTQRPPVNWMTTPDIRPSFSTNDHYSVSGTGDYFLPSFSDVYNGISGISTEHTNNNLEQSFSSWSATGNRSVLPTLLGDLALNVTNVNSSVSSAIYTNSSTSKNLCTSSSASHNIKNNPNRNQNQYYPPFEPIPASDPTELNKEPTGSGFLSVSSILVGGKLRKNHAGTNQSKRHRDKSKPKTNTNESNSNYDNHKKYSGGYSAEDLIGDNQYENRANPAICLGGMETLPQQTYTQNQQQNSQSHHHNQSKHQNVGYVPPMKNQNVYQQGYQQQFSAPYPHHGEFSALLSAAVVDTYNKTFDGFVPVKPPTATPFDSYCSRDSAAAHHNPKADPERKRNNRRSVSHNTAPPTTTTTTFSEYGFLSMSGAVNSPLLSEDFHNTATPFPPPPPPLPTPVASSLTNFNLSAIFPEINKVQTVSTTATIWPHSKTTVSTAKSQTRYHQQQHQNSHFLDQQNTSEGVKTDSSYCHPQQHSTTQQIPHEGLYGNSSAQTFPPLLSHHQSIGNSDVTTVPTSFSFSFATH